MVVCITSTANYAADDEKNIQENGIHLLTSFTFNPGMDM